MPERPDITGELALAEARLAELDGERARLQARIEALRAAALAPELPITAPPPPATQIAVPTTQAEKVALFGQLFRGRADVYPRRWENARTGKSGYSPHCAKEWKRGCGKPKVKCGECTNKEFIPVTDRVLYEHLQGEIVAGVYPLVDGDRCHFVAVDFDGAGWQQDVSAYASTARAVGLPVAIERSRSGNGAHAWFFFAAAVPASAARQLSSYVLTEAMSRRSEIGMKSYDRLFPNQDTLPLGGFGNLIALPLQWRARQHGNSVFVNDAFQPFENQWEFLAGVQRIPSRTVELIAGEALRCGRVLGVPLAREDEDAPWAARPSRSLMSTAIPGPLPERIAVVLAQRLFIERTELTPALFTEIRRLASFRNPVFYERQGMRFSTAGVPRVVTCAEETDRHLVLPRGCLGALQDFAARHGIAITMRDERCIGVPLDAGFLGSLTTAQQEAARALLPRDEGVLVAPPGTGKTVLAAHMIARRAVNTLVLVHRKPLLDGPVRGEGQVHPGAHRDPETPRWPSSDRGDAAWSGSLLDRGKKRGGSAPIRPQALSPRDSIPGRVVARARDPDLVRDACRGRGSQHAHPRRRHRGARDRSIAPAAHGAQGPSRAPGRQA